MTRLLGRYRGQNGELPRDANQFKDFLRKLDKTTLDGHGVDPNDLDKLLTSSRDGKPFVWCDRKYMGTAASPVGAVMIYEQDGKDGKRMVAYEVGKIEEVDQATFKQLVPEAK